MCRDSDLFGDVIVTYDDVELWMMSVPNFSAHTPTFRIEHYIKNCDVANKIKSAKLTGYFYQIGSPPQPARFRNFDTVYVELYPLVVECPKIFHVCENVDCDIYKANLKKEKNRASYAKWKAKRGKR